MRYTNLDGSQRDTGVGELLRWQLGLHEEKRCAARPPPACRCLSSPTTAPGCAAPRRTR